MTEQEQRNYIKSHIGDKWWRMNNLYHIENEQGKLVQFKLRPAQELLFRCMWWLNIILKARQLGFSTAIDIYLLDEALFNKNLKCGIIAQDQKAAGEIYRTKIEIPFDNLPAWLKATFKIESRRGGASGGYILFKHGSSIQVATSFRSGTVQRLHVSELGKICAKYPEKAKEVRTGTLNAIHPGCIAFIESTAEGVGGDFYEMSINSLELANANAELSQMDWKFHFFAWWQDPKYKAQVSAAGLILSSAQSEYFAAIEQAMNMVLTDEQKQWYVNKEREQKGEMKQEFPSTPLEAFLTSGRRVFDAIDTLNATGDCIAPLLVYEMDPVTGTKTKVRKPERMDQQGVTSLESKLLVWELPDDDEDYVIGADIAEGLEHGDRSSLDVINKKTGEQVAHWFGHLDTDRFARLMAHIGKFYNIAYIGPERNNHGHAVLNTLKTIYPVRRIYSEEYLDKINDEEKDKLGWLTTRYSKPVLTEGLKTLFRNNQSGIRWIGTINEATTYVYEANGSMNAQTGCYDDQLMSYMIAQEMRVRAPNRIKRDESTDKTRKTTSHQDWMTH